MEEQLRKAFEEVTTRNVKTIEQFTRDTRELVREQDEKIKKLESFVLSQKDMIDQMRSQLASVQAKIYQGGT